MKTLDSKPTSNHLAKPLLIHAETGLLFTFDERMSSDSDIDVLYWVLTEELGFVPQVRGGIA